MHTQNQVYVIWFMEDNLQAGQLVGPVSGPLLRMFPAGSESTHVHLYWKSSVVFIRLSHQF